MSRYEKARIELLRDFEYELKRFQIKYEEALAETLNSYIPHHNPKWASLKRASLDMKQELTKITQFNNFVDGKL
ncbi:MAG: hypothetical protein GY775_16655 [Candidatus Scalindua sp.]|nr:hypothetical protein [Candidatus Scalindua sp.]